jgi:hypothetical protein
MFDEMFEHGLVGNPFESFILEFDLAAITVDHCQLSIELHNLLLVTVMVEKCLNKDKR